MWTAPESWSGKGTLMCEHCGKLVRGSRMRAHLTVKHAWGVFACQACQHVAFSPENIADHILDKHKELENMTVAKYVWCSPPFWGSSINDDTSKRP